MNSPSQHRDASVPVGRIEHAKDALERKLQTGDMSIEDKRALHDAREAFSLHLEAMDEKPMPAKETPDLEEGLEIAVSRLENLVDDWYEGKNYEEVPGEAEFVEHLDEFVDIYEETFNRYEGENKTKLNEYLPEEGLIESSYKDSPPPKDGNLF